MRQLGGFFPGWNVPARQADEEPPTPAIPHAAVVQSLLMPTAMPSTQAAATDRFKAAVATARQQHFGLDFSAQ
jgi:hypothetical protein